MLGSSKESNEAMSDDLTLSESLRKETRAVQAKGGMMDDITDSDRYNEMHSHLQALCDDLEKTHGVEVRGSNGISWSSSQLAILGEYEICLRCKATGSIAAAHAKAAQMAKLAEQMGLVKPDG
jgi:hypothetical protein